MSKPVDRDVIRGFDAALDNESIQRFLDCMLAEAARRKLMLRVTEKGADRIEMVVQ